MQTFSIDQTAELLMRFTHNNAPCDYSDVINKFEDDWCEKHCDCAGEDIKSLSAVKECWIHAFKEGFIK